MCIIAVKPKGVEPPSKEILKTMFERNSDGAGVAYNQNNKLYIVKGLMTKDDFIQICESIPKESAVIYHARIQTSGGICKELTHPFPITNDIKKQRKTFLKIDKGEAIAHNGIFSEFEKKELNNDTTQFISNYLYSLKKMKDKIGESVLDDDLELIINKLCGCSNKIAIINEKGQIRRYGSGWIYDNGIYYSNHTYERYQSFFSDYTFSGFNCLSWKDNSIASKVNKNINEQIENLRKNDKEFNRVYLRWQNEMSDMDILECYENGWI